jgi:hypothetical protein
VPASDQFFGLFWEAAAWPLGRGVARVLAHLAILVEWKHTRPQEKAPQKQLHHAQ